MSDKRISQLVARVTLANNDVFPIVASGAATTNKVTLQTIDDYMQTNLDFGVTSVAMSVPTGLTVTGSPITSTGTFVVSFTAGYSIPTTAKQTQWDTAYNLRLTSATAPLGISSNVISITQSGAASNGYLSSTDWNTFNNKQATITTGNLTEATSSVLTITGGTGSVLGSGTTIQVKQASGSQNGFISSTDWTTFNGKQNALGGTGIVKSTGGTISYLTDSTSNWDAAYNDKIISAAVTGTTTKTLTLTQQDAGTITATWTDDNTDAVTSVFGRTGAVVATSGDYNSSQVTENTNLYYTDTRARLALSGSTGISYNNTTGAISSTITQYTDALARAAFSETVTGLDYSSATGVLSTTAGYGIPTTASQATWDAAYNDKINSAAVTGTTTKTLTLTQQDGGTITASWTDINTDAVTSVFGRTGAIVATSGDYNTDQVTEGTTNLYFTNTRARSSISLTTTGTSGVSSYSNSTGVLNVPNYTLAGLGGQPALNGTGFVKATGTTITYDNSTYLTTSSAASTYLPLAGGIMTGNLQFSVGSGNDWFIESSACQNGPWIRLRTHTAQAGYAYRSGALGFVDGLCVKYTVLQWDDSRMDIYVPTLYTYNISSTGVYYSNVSSGYNFQAITPDGANSYGLFGYSFYVSTTSHEIARITGNYETSTSGGRGGLFFKTRNDGTLATRFTINGDGTSIFTSSVTASSFIKSGGTSSQFLKADGSVDSSTYYLASNPNAFIALTALSFVAGSGAYNSTTGVITIPTNNNQITNGAGYITSAALTGYLTETNYTYQVTKSLSLTAGWIETGINSSALGEGTYLVKCYVDNYASGGGQYTTSYVGIMYWRGNGTNSSNACEIPLHHSGHSDGGVSIYLRTQTTFNADGKTYLQIRGQGTTTAGNYVFTFKRLL